jgi:hypothetical protein
MNQLKVLHLIHLKEVGGFENILCDFLAKPVEGVQFFVFSPHRIFPFWQERLNSINIPFYSGDKSRGRQWKNDFIEYTRKNQIDIIHSHIRVQRFFLKTGAKVIFEHCHGTIQMHSHSQVLEDRFNKRYVDGVMPDPGDRGNRQVGSRYRDACRPNASQDLAGTELLNHRALIESMRFARQGQ